MIKKYFKLKNYILKLKSLVQRPYSKSYAQNGEDIILWNLCHMYGLKHPSYIDIGAFHPKKLNNTYLFYLHGSRGINIEPNSDAIPAFKKARPKDLTINAGIGYMAGELPYYVMSTPTLNTFSEKEAREYESFGYIISEIRTVPVITISEVLEKYCNSIFPDILSLDVEGLDFEILQSIDWSTSAPKIICVETAKFSNNNTSEKIETVKPYLEEKGYTIYADVFINTIFIKKDAF